MRRDAGPVQSVERCPPLRSIADHHTATFQTTSWASVIAATGSGDEASRALECLCRTYWSPLYCYLRRHGQTPEAARDLTQHFFLKLLQQDSLKKADPNRGRFRTYLLSALKNLLVDEWKSAQSAKRGAGKPVLSLDSLEEAERNALEPVHEDTPALAFERQWARVVLQEAARRHREQYIASGQSELYARLAKLHSALDGSPGYAAVAAEMAVPVGTLKSLVSRFRQKYRELIRSVIAETVASPEDVEDEIRHLLSLFAR